MVLVGRHAHRSIPTLPCQYRLSDFVPDFGKLSVWVSGTWRAGYSSFMNRYVLLLVGCILLTGCGGNRPAETLLVPDAVPDRNFDEEAENQAIEKVRQLGGRCTRHKSSEAVSEITFQGVPLKDAELDLLKSFPKLTGLTIQDCPGFTGTGLKHLIHTPKLSLLQLAGKDIQASALAELTHTPKLRFLALARVQLLVNDLQHIAKLQDLQTLELLETPLSEAHLKPLGELPEMMELVLRDTWLTREAAQGFANSVNANRPKGKPLLGISF
jgi:hypothetical protein